MSLNGQRIVKTDPIADRRKKTAGQTYQLSSVLGEGNISEGDSTTLIYDITDANVDNISTTFLEANNNIVPLFYSSERNNLNGGMKLYSPDNISSLDVYNNSAIRPIGMVLLNDDLTGMQLIKEGDLITISNLFNNINTPELNQFFELWYNEILGFEIIMNPISTLQYINYHWYLGQYQLTDTTEIKCIKPENKLYFRRG